METEQRHRAKKAFDRQGAKTEGEDELFWLTEAEVLAKLALNTHRRRVLEAEKERANANKGR